MPAPQAIATSKRAKQFARALTCLVREVLDRLPERETLAFLDEIHGSLTTELLAQRMELESIAGTADCDAV